MRKRTTIKSSLVCSLAGIIAVGMVTAGCDPVPDALTSQAKSELLVMELDSNAVNVSEAIKAASSAPLASDADEASPAETQSVPQDVILKAKVGAGKGETFEPNISAFLVSEIPAGEHADTATHDSSNCPFCRAREAKAPTVMVRLVDKTGQPFHRSADQLLGLTKGQHVVVKGKGQFDPELNFYTVEANQLQILK